MVKKKTIGKSIAAVALMVLTAIMFSLIFTACATNITVITENGEYNFGMDKVVVSVPSGNESEYNVTVNKSETDYSGETLVQTLERIRPTVVDVYASSVNSTSAGSGVIIGGINKSGDVSVGASEKNIDSYDQYYIVTNHHVIDGGKNFSVDLLFIAEDGTESNDTYAATLIGGSPRRDIAILRIDRKSTEKIELADIVMDSDKIKVGTEVLAIGNPLGILGGTVTKGIVSATAREVNFEGIGTMTLMQTDAAINGGNSGGGLFDTDGRLVGIVNSGYENDSSGASVEGLNFAIPANDAVFASTSLIETHKDTDGAVTEYGYVVGDIDFGISCKDTTFGNAISSINVTYAYSVSTSSPVYGKIFSQVDCAAGKSSYWNAITAISYNNVKMQISKASELAAVLANAEIGKPVTFTVKKITTSFGRMTLDNENATDITVNAVQYVYTI